MVSVNVPWDGYDASSIRGAAGSEALPRTTAASPLCFEAIVQAYQARIARYILRLVDDPELALDLTQDTFVNAYRSIHTLRSELALNSWLYKIATNLAVQARWRRQRIRFQPFANLENSDKHAVAAPDSNVMERELVHRALAALPRNRAACLLLHANEGFSYTEVAAIMGITPEAARKRISRAKEQFRAIYDTAQDNRIHHALP